MSQQSLQYSFQLIILILSFLCLSTFFTQRIKSSRNNYTSIGSFESVYIGSAISLLMMGLNALMLVTISQFSLTSISIISALEAGIVIFLQPLSITQLLANSKQIQFSPTKQHLFLGATIILQIYLYFHPFEYILGGRDPGVYVQQGAYFSNHGTLNMADEISQTILNMPNAKYEYFYQYWPNLLTGQTMTNFHWQSPGFFFQDLKTGVIQPQFFYLYPALIAIFNVIGGLYFSLYITPLVALLCSGMVYSLTKQIFNRQVALWSYLLFSFNFAVVWYSRYPNSEMVSLLSMLVGLFLLHLAIQSQLQNRLLNFLCGMVLTAGMLARIDYIFTVVILIGTYLFLRITKKHMSIPSSLIIGSLVSTIWASYLGVAYSWLYIKMSFFPSGINFTSSSIFIYIAVILILCLGTMYLWISKLWIHKMLRQHYEKLVIVLVLCNILLFGFFVFRSAVSPTLVDNGANLFKLGWYLSEGVVVSGFVMLPLILKSRSLVVWLVYLVAEFYFVFYIYNARILPDHPWWVRRFLPVVIPFLVISFSNFIQQASTTQNRILAKVAPYVIYLLASYYVVTSSLSLSNFTMMQGLTKDIHTLAHQLDGSLIITTPYMHHHLTSAFMYIYDLPVLPLQVCESPECVQVQQLAIQTLAPNFKQIYILTSDDKSLPSLGPLYNATLVDEKDMIFPDWEQRPDKLSLKSTTSRFSIKLYSLTPTSP